MEGAGNVSKVERGAPSIAPSLPGSIQGREYSFDFRARC